MKGKLITLEGGEGTGKTSQIKYIEEFFEKKNIPYISTREPGGINIAEQIREVILDRDNTVMDKRTEALLYAAARRQHLVEKILPALKEGKVVISDRFVDASLVYQGYARGIGMDKVMEINEFAIDGCMPYLTIYLDINPQIGLNRIIKNKNREINRLDLENVDFHNKVRKGYMILLKKYPKRIKIVDANQSIEKVSQDIINIIADTLNI